MDRLGKYEIRGEIGSGTTGKVYEGWDPQIRRRVAIKAIRLLDAADSEAREQLDRFKQEARSAGRLQHPNIVGAFDYAETPELAYIVMEFVDGRTLKSILEDGPRPDVAEVVRLMDGLLSGLDYSHRNQVIHRDIKPANVMVTSAGVVKIADFGIARIGGGTMTRVGTIMGTPAYMSPEQIQGMETDARTDVYSAGVVLFQLLSGKRPFDGTMATIMNAVVNGPTPRASAKCARVTPALDAVVARAMARSPDDRYATAAAFNQALRAAVGAEESAWPDDATNDDATIVGQASVVGGPARPPSSGQTRRRDELEPVAAPTSGRGAATPSLAPKLLIGAAVLLVVAGGVLWAVTGRAPKPRPDTLATGVPAQSPSAPLTPAPEPRSPPGLASGQPATELPSASLLPPMTTPTSPGLPDEPEGPRSETQVAAVKPATTVPPNSVRRAIASVVSAAGCSVVTGDDQPEATPVLRGVVGRGQSETALRAAVRDAAPELAPDWQVAIADGPYCAVLDTVRPYARPFGGGPGLGVTLAGRRTSLVADELIMPRVTMPDFAGSLQLDYVASDGSVVHLHEALNGVPYAALSTSEFGKPRPPGFGGWAVDKPFGTDLIVGIASSRPLFRSPRPASENLENYLRDLRVALDQADREGARVAAAVLLVTTSAKP